MWWLWLGYILLTLVTIIIILYTVVSCFWSIYLIDGIKRKRSFYKSALRCVERESNTHQQMLAYNAKTQLVKFVYLFFLNLLEWVGVILAGVEASLIVIASYEKVSHHIIVNSTFQVPPIYTVFAITSMAILGSLCDYLSARYAHKSWIKSEKFPYWICFFLFSSIAGQILLTVCYTHIVGMWFNNIIYLASVIYPWKQYRKLNMVLQWFVVDLRVSGHKKSLEYYVRMKRRFNRILTAVFIGSSLMLFYNFIFLITQTTRFILRMYNHVFTDSLLCSDLIEPDLDSVVFPILTSFASVLIILGFSITIISYIGYGLFTMCVILWRLFRGKTGYRTHFHVQLTRPLI